jgi:tRNA A37 methylthiotransferase MiaB
VPAAVVDRRRETLRTLEKDLAMSYYRSLVGRVLDVLIEGPDPQRPGRVIGTSCRYAPVSVPGYAAALIGRRVPVRAVRLDDGMVLAEPEPEGNRQRGPGRIALPLFGDASLKTPSVIP